MMELLDLGKLWSQIMQAISKLVLKTIENRYVREMFLLK